jgi:hypothetical protein
VKDELIAELVAALGAYDNAGADCPANKSFLGDKPCPRCGAGSREGCGEVDRAAYRFIQTARIALAKSKAKATQ